MKQYKLLLVLFLLGLLIGAIFQISRVKQLTQPIASRLPDLIFPRQEENTTLTLLFTGDVMLARSVNTRILKYQDPSWPFRKIADFLSQADITVVNLESPLVHGCKPTDQGMIFCADPQNVQGLVFAGVDYASLANNHINNYGEKGLNDTVSILTQNGITPLGLGKPEYTTIKDKKLAFLSFSDLPYISDTVMVNQISQATSSADLVIVTFHWGNEYQSQPSGRQVYLGHLAVDSGADLVVGHHPHWVQTEEIYRGKPIFYSLGNLVFDQMWSENTRLGEILKVTYTNGILIKKELFPIKIFDYGQPDFYSPSSARK